MSWTNCPHCGAQNFTVVAWADLDHCSSCGQSLATAHDAEVDDRIFGSRCQVGARALPAPARRRAITELKPGRR